MPIEQETEEKIFRAAQQVFQKKGFAGARMQEIADKAGINKSMLHYYYRSKDKLFFEVFQSGVRKIMPQLFHILASNEPLDDKVKQVVEFYHSTFEKNPDLPSFIIYEMNQNPERFKEFIASLEIRLPDVFINQIAEQVDKGNFIAISPPQFLMNMVSMCLMPMVAKNMAQTIFGLSEENYRHFLNERKDLIPNIIMKGVKKS